MSVLFIFFGLLMSVAVFHADLGLIRQALSGGQSAMSTLIHRLVPVVRARAEVYVARRRDRRLGGLDADDLTQEIWLVLLEQEGRLLKAWDPERGMRLEGYVGLIAQRELWRRAESARAARRGGDLVAVELSEAPQLSSADEVETAVADRQALKALWVHLEAELPARGRLVLNALYIDGLSVDDAAALIGVKRQVIYNWQHKIRRLARGWAEEVA